MIPFNDMRSTQRHFLFLDLLSSFHAEQEVLKLLFWPTSVIDTEIKSLIYSFTPDWISKFLVLLSFES